VGAPVGVVAGYHMVLRVEGRLPGGDVREDLRGVAGVDDLGVAGGEQFLVELEEAHVALYLQRVVGHVEVALPVQRYRPRQAEGAQGHAHLGLPPRLHDVPAGSTWPSITSTTGLVSGSRSRNT